MDAFTERHFRAWLDGHVSDEERDSVEFAIRRLVSAYPELVGDRSWSELRALAER